jgi:carbon-monoxide dehydrogenase medium subunit
MHAFDYVRPSTVDEAVAALGNEDAVALAGGQTLLPTMKQRLAAPSAVVDLRGIADLGGIVVQGGSVSIGATTTHAQVAGNAELKKALPALCALADGIGDPQVRHMGTIGGSVANNDPAADYPAGMLGLGATIKTNKREIAADDFFQGLFTTALDAGEIITSIAITVPKRAAYAKFEQRASRYALVGVFVSETDGGVRVAVTGAGNDGVFRVTAIEQALAGSLSGDAARGVSISPDDMLSDIHAGGDYRAALVSEMAAQAVEKMLAA